MFNEVVLNIAPHLRHIATLYVVNYLCSEIAMFKKGKERKSNYIALFWPRWYTQSAQAWITQFYLKITPCLPFLRERSLDVTTTATEAADIQLQLTTNLSTPKASKVKSKSDAYSNAWRTKHLVSRSKQLSTTEQVVKVI